MIEENELRKGNLVYEANETLTEIINGWQIDEGMELFPIPLNADWLLKCGFRLNENNEPIKVISDNKILYLLQTGLDFYPVLEEESLEAWEQPAQVHLNSIQSLHQLQNIYFILASEELKINP